jgi:hypothetical protein
LAKAESVQELECARGQWKFMMEAARKLEDCRAKDRSALEKERDWRLGNAKSHLELGTVRLFDAFAEQCWNVVRPDAEQLSTLLPIVTGEVRKVMIFPELESIISDMLTGRGAKWANQTRRQSAITNSHLWSDLGAAFSELARREAAALQGAPGYDRLHALGDYTLGGHEAGEWALTGSTESVRADFERVATRAGIALGAPEGIDALSYWLHCLFIDLQESGSSYIRIYRGQSGVIRELLDASAVYGARLERIAAENDRRRRSTMSVEGKKIPGSSLNAVPSVGGGRGKVYKTALGRNIDRFRKECGLSFHDLAKVTGLDKKLVLGHVNGGKGAHPQTLATYAQTFMEKLERPVTVAELESSAEITTELPPIHH